jgi:hypothetical protein
MTRSDAACLTPQTHAYQNGRGIRAGEEVHTFLCHSALGSASFRSPPVTAAGGYTPLEWSRGQDTHAGKACSERAGPGKMGTGMEPCSALRVWLAHRASCHPAHARWPRNGAVTQRQKCALFFLYVEVEALEARLAFIEGHWTPLP